MYWLFIDFWYYDYTNNTKGIYRYSIGLDGELTYNINDVKDFFIEDFIKDKKVKRFFIHRIKLVPDKKYH